MKKLIVLFLVFFVVITPVNAIEVINEDDWEDFELLTTNTKYFKTTTVYGLLSLNNGQSETVEVTKEEYDSIDSSFNTIQLRNTTIVETTYKKMETSLYSNGSYYRYKNVLLWKNFPVVRSNDIIAIGFLPSVTPINYNFDQYYCEYGNGCGHLATAYPSLFSSGMSVIFPLVISDSLTMLRQTFYFDVSKTNPNSTILYQYAYGDYSHATSTIGITDAALHEVIQSAGIILNSSISSYYDSISVGAVYYECNW